ncbi:hypothetical protein HG530_013271 [Fusarium avenaceum]|nr:hypothetical protein DER45DRAFT_379046 [Fusarium avenaceum]KAI6754095.1 hypothetical protein HG530_013271 [Fusarium avenaceum]KIL90686.1 hypothetical protein FAVG1_06421 [Fusarium avenaceum]
MISIKAAVFSCLALSPLAINAGACKPRSTDITTILSSTLPTSAPISQSSEVTTVLSSDVTTLSDAVTTTISSSPETVSSEAPSATSSAPCPKWKQKNPPPSGKVCGLSVSRGNAASSPLYIQSPLSTTGLTGCAKYCGDDDECVSFYAEDYVPGPGAPTYKICFTFRGYAKDIPFGEGNGQPTYYEQGCFACDRTEPSGV